MRTANEAPLAWNTSTAIPIPKGNHKQGIPGLRLIHLLDAAGKAWYSGLWQSTTAQTCPLAFGYEKHKRREQAILIQKLSQYRAVRAGYNWTFTKYDVKNAFPSLEFAGIDRTLYYRGICESDLPFVRDRYRRSFTWLRARGEDSVLFKNGSGVLQGDSGAPQQFADT